MSMPISDAPLIRPSSMRYAGYRPIGLRNYDQLSTTVGVLPDNEHDLAWGTEVRGAAASANYEDIALPATIPSILIARAKFKVNFLSRDVAIYDPVV
jgi:hypothetical protein